MPEPAPLIPLIAASDIPAVVVSCMSCCVCDDEQSIDDARSVSRASPMLCSAACAVDTIARNLSHPKPKPPSPSPSPSPCVLDLTPPPTSTSS